MQLIHQVMDEQIKPGQPAQEHQDVPVWLLLARGDLFIAFARGMMQLLFQGVNSSLDNLSIMTSFSIEL